MTHKIAIIQGNPDPAAERYGRALADAYRKGAESAGHEVRIISIAELEFPWVGSKEDFYRGQPPQVIKQCQEVLAWADHWVFFYPLWLGAMPALLKAFLEQTLRPRFAFETSDPSRMGKKLLKGKSARIVVTMGMPALIYRFFYRAHSLKSFERNILSFCGIGPIRESVIGLVEAMPAEARKKWLAKMELLGRQSK